MREATTDQAERITIEAIDLGELGELGELGLSHHLPPPLPRLRALPLAARLGETRSGADRWPLPGRVLPALPAGRRTRHPNTLRRLQQPPPLPPGGGVLPDRADRRPSGAVPGAGGAGSGGDRKGAGGVFDGEGLTFPISDNWRP